MKKPAPVLFGLVLLLLAVISPAVFGQKITRVEYFIDTDPGFGMGIPVPVTPSPNISNLDFYVDVSALSQGFHMLYLRSRDSAGAWSHTQMMPFFSERQIASVPCLLKYEYFIDTDPGFGMGTAVGINPHSISDTMDMYFSTSSLSPGFHYFSIRAYDSLGRWSHTAFRAFVKNHSNDSIYPVVAMEYFIDSDPGFGQGIPISVPMALNINNLMDTLDVSGMTDGLHHLNIRARDSKGAWSHTNSQVFYKQSDEDQGISKIVYLEYFFNADPGFGQATGFAVPPSVNTGDITFFVDEACIPDGGSALFYVRSRDSAGRWSHTNIDTLLKLPLALWQSDTSDACTGDSVRLSVGYAAGQTITWYRNGAPLTGAHDSVYFAKSTGSYYVDVTNSLMCNDTSNVVYVDVHPIPLPPTATTAVSYCRFATSYPLSAVGDNLLWYLQPSGGIGNPTAPTPSTQTVGSTYHYVSQTVNGCESPRASIEVEIRPIPPTPTITQHLDSLLSDAPIGNQWYNSSGVLSGQTLHYLIPQSTEDYYVKVFLSGCMSLPSNTIHVVIPGIEQAGTDQGFRVFPNPFSDRIEISAATAKDMVCSLYAFDGGLIASVSHKGGGNVVLESLEQLSSGMYLLVIQVDDKVNHFKLTRR